MSLAAVEFGGKKVTVKDLIEALRACPDNAVVLVNAVCGWDAVSSVKIGSMHTPIIDVLGFKIERGPEFAPDSLIKEGWEPAILIR